VVRDDGRGVRQRIVFMPGSRPKFMRLRCWRCVGLLLRLLRGLLSCRD
jgi:hypothetical protein